MTNFETSYIRQNTPAVVENILKGFLWRGVPYFKGMENAMNYEREYHYVDPKKFEYACLGCIEKALSNVENFSAFLKSRRENIVRPYYKNTAAYLNGDWETSLNLYQLYNMLKAAQEGGRKHGTQNDGSIA